MAEIAFVDFRDWLLSDSDIATALGYSGGTKPFWPAQQQPESTLPYIIYNTRLSNDVEEWWMEEEHAAMAIHATSLGTAWEVFKLIQKKCNRGDESAKPLNKWLRGQGRNDFLFHSLEYLNGGDMGTADEEGGARPIFITIRYRYSPAQV